MKLFRPASHVALALEKHSALESARGPNSSASASPSRPSLPDRRLKCSEGLVARSISMLHTRWTEIESSESQRLSSRWNGSGASHIQDQDRLRLQRRSSTRICAATESRSGLRAILYYACCTLMDLQRNMIAVKATPNVSWPRPINFVAQRVMLARRRQLHSVEKNAQRCFEQERSLHLHMSLNPRADQ